MHQRIAGRSRRTGLPLLAQHVDGMDTATLIDIFRAEEDSCLLGTDAVRDGIDVPGRSLRLIVFDRVPWPRPDILHKARKAAFGGTRYDDMLTRLRLKQAFGRLVRRASDTRRLRPARPGLSLAPARRLSRRRRPRARRAQGNRRAHRRFPAGRRLTCRRRSPDIAAIANQGSSMIDHHAALIYTMVLVSASDNNMTDAEMRIIGDNVRDLPAFAGYDHDKLTETLGNAPRCWAARTVSKRPSSGSRRRSRHGCARPPMPWPATSSRRTARRARRSCAC